VLVVWVVFLGVLVVCLWSRASLDAGCRSIAPTFMPAMRETSTPPPQVVALPRPNLAGGQGTSQSSRLSLNDPVLPSRSHVFDVGVG